MGMYDLYRRMSLADLEQQRAYEAEQAALVYDSAMRLAEARSRDPAVIAMQQAHAQAVYQDALAQIDAAAADLATQIHQEYDQKDADYDAAMGALHNGGSAAPQYIRDFSADEPESDESFLASLFSWFH